MKNLFTLTATTCLLIFSNVYSQNLLSVLGNVGIGTIQPSAPLTVKGNTLLQTLTTTGAVTLKDNATIEKQLTVLQNTILQNTRVLGTLTLPALQLASKPVNELQVLVADATGLVTRFKLEDVVGGVFNPANQVICGGQRRPTWTSSDDKIFSYCPEVKVGIGTQNPVYSLDVRGSGYMSGGIKLGDVAASSASPALIEVVRSESFTNPLIRLAIKNSSGAVETRFKVEPDGTVYCTQVKVRPTTAIPDYVFKPSYKLMPLSELKTYVTTYSHLPNIPSESEILKDGLTLGEMQLKLLEKVEELTLYMIEVNAKNEELAKQNAVMAKEIEALKAQSSTSKR